MNIAQAHELGGTGLAKEFNHPLLGIDHLLDEPFLWLSAVFILGLSVVAASLAKIHFKKAKQKDDRNKSSVRLQ